MRQLVAQPIAIRSAFGQMPPVFFGRADYGGHRPTPHVSRKFERPRHLAGGAEVLQIAFETKPLRNVCENEQQAANELGPAVAAALKARLADLFAASSVDDLVVGRLRPIGGPDSNCMALDLCDGWILRFQANHPTNPVDDAGNLEWVRVTRIKVMSIERENA
jgi:hypothetical protein